MDVPDDIALLVRTSRRFSLLSHLLREQYDAGAWEDVRDACLAAEASVTEDTISPACAELTVAVNVAHESAALEEDFRHTFGHIPAGTFSQYETSYGPTNAFTQSQTLADIKGFYHAFGVEPAQDYRERADHLSLECEFMALLLYKEALALDAGNADGAGVCHDARRRFVEEHIGWWAGVVFDRLARDAPAAVYRLCGELGSALLAQERAALGVPDPVAECGEPPAGGIAEEYCPELFQCPEDAGREQFAC